MNETPWTLDAVHERIEACDTVIRAAREAKVASDWIDEVPLLLFTVIDEVLSGRIDAVRMSKTPLRRLKRLDEGLEPREVEQILARIRSRLLAIESTVEPEAPDGLRVVGENAVYLRPETPLPVAVKPELKAPLAERWRALQAHGGPRERVGYATKALSQLSLVLKAANGGPDLPFEGLDLLRAALTFQTAAHMLGAPLVETGILRTALRNAKAIEATSGDHALRETAKRAVSALEEVVADLR